ncbi:MAG TPA: hypothetical protein ENH45_03410 [Nitrospirae bacterium]|nr:hypothetical protein BMS3Abin09_01180 [bacterium BMS3Abin09]GBE41157.1 hypothetical protein BMS3Bbin09_01048 [bacterium BMS3Bbin09]HDH34156.1 hypothetical protein [Nitrospirota bacterium]HDO67170.1 hypothetical protein [Nitrospirota bacterium]HDZ84244.1 hypothetical protein [Nitrospirota bacterium]
MAYYRANLTGFEKKTDLFLDIFSEFDFCSVEDECNFFCPECRQIQDCKAYKEIKEVWRSFYM